ncbi:hypothetical protein GGF37_001306 [Kickxella alabastrina]|nr:hypothetical protein GGF37_001306 [Kickxella alabastrina]
MIDSYTAKDVTLMRQAIAQARLCTPTPTAFNVGALITDPHGRILSTGYSRQFPGNTHAEQCALQTLLTTTNSIPDYKDLVMYTTMEPCSERLSGNKPCVERILEAGIGSVVVGVKEPDNFVKCTGVQMLREKGVRVVVIGEEVEEECRKLNAHLDNE